MLKIVQCGVKMGIVVPQTDHVRKAKIFVRRYNEHIETDNFQCCMWILFNCSYLSDYPKVICSMDYTVKDVLF